MKALTPNVLALGSKCRVLRLPTDDSLIEALNEALAQLIFPSTWKQTGEKTPAETAAFMLEWWLAVKDSEYECGNQDGGCSDESAYGCEEYPANSAIFSYRPSDPFLTPQVVPLPYASHPFAIVGENPVVPGTLQGDVITSIDRLIPSLNPLEIIAWALENIPSWGLDLISDLEADKNLFPRFNFHIEGSGEVELHLLKVPQGGLAIISVDGSPDVKVVDLQSFSVGDLNSWVSALSELGLGFLGDIVGTLVAEEIIELQVEGAGDHSISVTFVPKISGTMLGGLIPEFGWGGGLRKVAICGAAAIGAEPTPKPAAIRVNGDCIERLNPTGEWECIQTLAEFLKENGISAAGSNYFEDECGECDVCKCQEQLVRVDPCGAGLQYFKDGAWLPLPTSVLPNPSIPTPDPDQTATGSLACYKANGVWSAIERTMDAFIDACGDDRSITSAYTYFQQNYADIDEDNASLLFYLGEWAAGEIDPGTITHWEDNKEFIKNDFVCAMQDEFEKTAVLSSGELSAVKNYNFSTGSNQLNSLIEDVVEVPEDDFYRVEAGSFAKAAIGDCNCVGSSPNPDTLPVGTGQIRLVAVEAFSRNVSTTMELLDANPEQLMTNEGDDFTVAWGNGWTQPMMPDVPNNNSQWNPRYIYKIEGDFAAWEPQSIQIQFTAERNGSTFNQLMLIGTSPSETDFFDIRYTYSSTSVFKSSELVNHALLSTERWIAIVQDMVLTGGTNKTGFAGFVVLSLTVKKLSDNSIHIITPGQTLTA